MRGEPRLYEVYPGICLTTKEKARKTLIQGKRNLSQVKKNLSQGKKNLSQVNKNLSQRIVYILPKHTYITKTHNILQKHTHTLQKHTHTHITETHPHITKTHTHITETHTHYRNTHRHTHTHTLQKNIKPPQYKLRQTDRQTQCKIYPNKIVWIQVFSVTFEPNFKTFYYKNFRVSQRLCQGSGGWVVSGHSQRRTGFNTMSGSGVWVVSGHSQQRRTGFSTMSDHTAHLPQLKIFYFSGETFKGFEAL